MPKRSFDLWDGVDTSEIEGVLDDSFMALISVIASTVWNREYDMNVLPSDDANTVRVISGGGGIITLFDNDKVSLAETDNSSFDRYEYSNAGIDFDPGISVYMKADVCLWSGSDSSAAGFIVDDGTDRIFLANRPGFLGVYNFAAVSHGEGGVVEIVWTFKRSGANIVCNAWVRSDQQEWVQVITNQNATLSGGSGGKFTFGSNINNASLVISYDFLKLFIGDIDPNTNGFYDKTSPSPAQQWNEYAIGETVDMSTITIVENARADDTGSIKYQYAKNNGVLNGSWLTLVQLQSESDFEVIHANSFKVVPQLTSNGNQPTSVATVGEVDVIAATGGGVRGRQIF